MKKRKSMIHIEFTQDPVSELKGRQSVRTTFKLSERSIQALSILAVQMGIKQKSLFDHLVNDVNTLKAIAKEFDSYPTVEHRVAKTFVISRSTLESLDKVSNHYKTPRDALVEFSIGRILPLIEQEKEKHRRRTEFANKLKKQFQQSIVLFEEAQESLGEEDLLVQEMFSMLKSGDSSLKRIEAYLEKGKKIESF